MNKPDKNNAITGQLNEPETGDVNNPFAVFLETNPSLMTLFESIAEGVVVIGESGNIHFVNSRLEKMTGFAGKEVVGNNINILIPEKFQQNHPDHVRSFFNNPQIRPIGVGLNLWLRLKDNTELPVEISLGYLDLESGRFAIGFVTDISLQKKAEDELKKSIESLNAFSHTVAHEINTSLNGIILMNEMITDTDNNNLTAEQRKYVNDIKIIANKLNSVVNEILLFASKKAGDVRMEKINMKQTIESALERLNRDITEKEAIINIQKDMPDCLGYGAWIEEIWYNFISNALKYGGTTPVVAIGFARDENFIRYFVKDNGEGWRNLSPETMANRPKIIRPVKGFGLGLSIAQKIIERLGGTFEIKSESGEGSTVSFTLQAAKSN